MKLLILTIFTFVLALANAALVRRNAEDDFSLLAREVDKSNAHMVFGTLPDGRRRVSLYEGGQFLGAIEEGPGGGDNATAYDAYGQVMEIDDDDDENDGEEDDKEDGEKVRKLYPRQRLTIIRKLWRFIRKYGQKAWNFFRCLSFEVTVNCADNILRCLGSRDPSECLEYVVCGGKAFRDCVIFLR